MMPVVFGKYTTKMRQEQNAWFFSMGLCSVEQHILSFKFWFELTFLSLCFFFPTLKTAQQKLYHSSSNGQKYIFSLSYLSALHSHVSRHSQRMLSERFKGSWILVFTAKRRKKKRTPNSSIFLCLNPPESFPSQTHLARCAQSVPTYPMLFQTVINSYGSGVKTEFLLQ